MRRSFFVLFLFAVILLLVAAFLYKEGHIALPSERHIRVAVIATEHRGSVIATGSLEARDDVALAFEEGGVVSDILLDVGDTANARDVIAVLEAGALLADVQAQQQRVQKEEIRLGSFVGGPEEKERAHISASVAVAREQAESKTGVALASIRQIAGEVENMIRTDVDSLFENALTDPKLTSRHVPVSDSRDIGHARRGFEVLFERWRTLPGVGGSSYTTASSALRQFEADLRQIHDGVIALYDALLPLRTLSEEGDREFLLVADVRSTILEHTVAVSRHMRDVAVANAEYNRARAQADRDFAGGTQADRLAQSAQVEVEREKLRRLELQLEKTRIRAPFTGVVGDVFVEVGEFVAAGSDAVRLVSDGGFDLSVDVTEVDVHGIAAGQTMRARIGATGEEIGVIVRTVSGTERRVDDVPVYTVSFSLADDIGGELRPGMTVDVRIPVGDSAPAFVIPRAALETDGARHTVRVDRGGSVFPVAVTVGPSSGESDVIVTGDFRDGDFVIVPDGP